MYLILIGFKSCGKTTLGSKLSKRVQLPFFDTDCLVEDWYEKRLRKKCTYREIYQNAGKDFFSFIETKVLEELDPTQTAILSVGGSTPLFAENLLLLRQLGPLLYLKQEKEVLKKRIFQADPPLFLNEENFEKIYQQRTLAYEHLADHILDLKNQNEAHILAKLQAKLQEWVVMNYGKQWQATDLELSFASPLGENPTEKPSVL